VDRAGKGLRSAPRDALLAGSVDPALHGTAFGLHRAADHAGAVLGPILASALLLGFAGELRPVFALAAVPGAMAALMVLWKVREVAPLPSPRAEVDAPVRALGPAFLRYLAILVVFTLGNATDAFLLLRAGQLGVPLAVIPLLWGVHHASKMIWSVAGGMLSDRFGPRRSIVAGWLLYAATYAAFGYATSTWHVWALFVVYGLFYGLTEAPEKALVARLVPAHRSGAGFGAYHFAIGLAALPASVLFGVLWSAFGPRTAFLTGAGLALLAALLLALLVRPARTTR
jgi:MFS family permease